eukprot:300398-Prymnesium_polylepis.1
MRDAKAPQHMSIAKRSSAKEAAAAAASGSSGAAVSGSVEMARAEVKGDRWLAGVVSDRARGGST